VWLIIAGADICNDLTWGKRDVNVAQGMPRREGPLWSKKLAAGVIPEARWDFWKGRQLEITGDESLDMSTRETAREVERAMGSQS
jgi:hypothetical protein